MEIWLSDEKTGLQYGKNDDGDLFLGDQFSGGNLPDTPENRIKLIRDFCRYTGRVEPIMSASGKPIQVEGTLVEFSR